MNDLSDAVEGRIRSAFDLTRISKEIVAKGTSPDTLQAINRTHVSYRTTESTSIGQGLLYKSRVRTEPTSVTAPQWTSALWGSLESLIEEMADCCVKVYTLEKVLKVKRDPVTDVVFLDEAMKVGHVLEHVAHSFLTILCPQVLENRPSTTFWASLGRSLEKNARDAAKGAHIA